MFDTYVPASMHALPGRVHAMTDSADHEARPAKRTYLERLQQMRSRTAAIPREIQRQRDRASYARQKLSTGSNLAIGKAK